MNRDSNWWDDGGKRSSFVIYETHGFDPTRIFPNPSRPNLLSFTCHDKTSLSKEKLLVTLLLSVKGGRKKSIISDRPAFSDMK